MDEGKKYLDHVRSQMCSVEGCGDGAVPHHCSSGGMGMKCSDFETIPLCTKHHRELHDGGKITFERNHPECYRIGLKLLAEYVEKQFKTGPWSSTGGKDGD